MPTYDQTDASTHDGEPLEFYELIGPAITYRYTNDNWDQVADTGAGDETFVAAAIKRSAILMRDGSEELQVELPGTLAVCQVFAFRVSPTSLLLRVWRRHGATGELRRIWSAPVAGFTGQLPLVTLRSPAKLGAALQQELPRGEYGPQCWHILGDAMCQVDLDDPDFTITGVTVTVEDGVEITVDADGGKPDGWFTNGWVIRVADGERRYVEYHAGNVLRLIESFSELAGWDGEVELVAGCDGTLLGTNGCIEKFANVLNFFAPGVFMTGRDPRRGIVAM